MNYQETTNLIKKKEKNWEELFIENSCSCAILQVREDIPEYRDIHFEGYDNAVRCLGRTPERNDYNMLYVLPFSQEEFDEIEEVYGDDRLTAISEYIYENFNQSFKPNADDGYFGTSLSISDIILIKEEKNVGAMYVDRQGFVELENFDVSKNAHTHGIELGDCENLTAIFHDKVASKENQKSPNMKKFVKALDWFDKNGNSIYKTSNGNYFFYQDKTAGYPKGISSDTKMPNFVLESIYKIFGKCPIAKNSLYFKAEYVGSGKQLIITDKEFSKHKFAEVQKNGPEPIRKIGYASAKEIASLIDAAAQIELFPCHV